MFRSTRIRMSQSDRCLEEEDGQHHPGQHEKAAEGANTATTRMAYRFNFVMF
jgi:hypothetical protein